MTIETALARLTAGLDRDEAAALELCPGRKAENGHWRADSVALSALGDPRMAAYVASHSPADTLGQVEAIRRVLGLHEEAERDSVLSDRDAGFEAGIHAALEILAGIYTEPTEERDE